jgi:DNA-binding MarR family transcriptional regulator
MTIDPLADYPGYLLRRVSVAAMADVARRLKTLELRPAEATVVLIIEANRNITPSMVGRMADIATPNMVPLLAKLARRGLIARKAVDGRSHGLSLTGEGLAIARKAKKAIETHERALWGRIPNAQRTTFLAALRALWSAGWRGADRTRGKAVRD